MGDKKNAPHSTGQPQVIRPVSIPSAEAVGTPTVWLSYSFAPGWFYDALNEATTGKDHHARRREIVFAVCFAESYLVEWVRDEVLQRDFKELNQFFPPGKRRGVTEKWKEVPKSLHDVGLIKAAPDLSQRYWKEWLDLVDMRNGLIHARASRPETDSQPSGQEPLPSKGDLDTLCAGWAISVVITLVEELHKQIGTKVPDWLKKP